MCEFCHQHGEGKKWYLNANNYAEDLMSDLGRRRFITRFFENPGHLAKGERALTALDVMPDFLWKGVRRKITAKQKPRHFGQVVPLEDIECILALTTSVVRVACLCRHVATGGREQRYCFGVSMSPDGGGMAGLLREIDASYLVGPHAGGLESMPKDKALALIRESEREGNCHTVWTFLTPFLAGICNCSLPSCYAMKTTVGLKTPVFFRGNTWPASTGSAARGAACAPRAAGSRPSSRARRRTRPRSTNGNATAAASAAAPVRRARSPSSTVRTCPSPPGFGSEAAYFFFGRGVSTQFSMNFREPPSRSSTRAWKMALRLS